MTENATLWASPAADLQLFLDEQLGPDDLLLEVTNADDLQDDVAQNLYLHVTVADQIPACLRKLARAAVAGKVHAVIWDPATTAHPDNVEVLLRGLSSVGMTHFAVARSTGEPELTPIIELPQGMVFSLSATYLATSGGSEAEPTEVHVSEGSIRAKINQRQYTVRFPSSPLMEGVLDGILRGEEYPYLPFLRPGNIVDIGANVGGATVWFSAIYPGARIFAFEPCASTFEYLKRNTAELPNAQVFGFGLFDRDGQARLYHGNAASVTNAVADSILNGGEFEDVQLRRASSILAAEKIDQISLLKIDTEGAEVPILRDLEPMLPRIDAIMLEYHSERDRIEIDRILSEHFVLVSGRAHRAHLGTFVYVAKSIIAERTSHNALEIDRARL